MKQEINYAISTSSISTNVSDKVDAGINVNYNKEAEEINISKVNFPLIFLCEEKFLFKKITSYLKNLINEQDKELDQVINVVKATKHEGEEFNTEITQQNK